MIVVDRIVGDRAVLEIDGNPLDVPLALLPPGVREGAVLRLVLDPDAEAHVRDEAEARLHRLRTRSSQGPGTFDL